MLMAKRLSGLAPVLVLFVLATVIPEFLSASTPASRANQLIFESLLYGPAALLIREFVRRRKLGPASIVVLGLAFGVLQECILLQSVFNPGFLGLDLSFGRAMGVNWIWAEAIIVYHAVWSVGVPIAVSELLFPARSDRPWLRWWGIALHGLLFLLACAAFFAIFRKLSGYMASPNHFAAAGGIALGLAVVSCFLPVRWGAGAVALPRRPVLAMVGLVAGVLWLGVLASVFAHLRGLEPWMAGLGGLCILGGFGALLLRWSRAEWSPQDRLMLLAGLTAAILLSGLNVTINSSSRLDRGVQVALLVAAGLLTCWLYSRLGSAERRAAHMQAA
jgi:hypothetical protein